MFSPSFIKQVTYNSFLFYLLFSPWNFRSCYTFRFHVRAPPLSLQTTVTFLFLPLVFQGEAIHFVFTQTALLTLTMGRNNIFILASHDFSCLCKEQTRLKDITIQEDREWKTCSSFFLFALFTWLCCCYFVF